ncbi:hypothetical protein LZ496_10345 [Sphingomonas sp. NSE70-1]|uniref:Histidine kinase n=1 Tax=Sphingomonas caseinilyticus TaxID=2908205 RepID=A0ABT0RVX0_9SPHN|nr:hypothetical protein [Sphingomonas caseinilyticus]MCL6699177.1 hypothetical protein [Sphingomonas caseinilyticus]
MSRAELLRRLLAPSITGARAFALVTLLIAIPTLIRAAVNGFVTGCEFSVFLPFVLAAAVFMEWRYAAIVALGSVGLADYLFMTHASFFSGPCDVYVVGIFLTSSTLIISLVQFVRMRFAGIISTDRSDFASGQVVFSLENNQAWAGWHGRKTMVQLGKKDDVAEMMEDFLAQLELAERLNSPRRD